MWRYPLRGSTDQAGSRDSPSRIFLANSHSLRDLVPSPTYLPWFCNPSSTIASLHITTFSFFRNHQSPLIYRHPSPHHIGIYFSPRTRSHARPIATSDHASTLKLTFRRIRIRKYTSVLSTLHVQHSNFRPFLYTISIPSIILLPQTPLSLFFTATSPLYHQSLSSSQGEIGTNIMHYGPDHSSLSAHRALTAAKCSSSSWSLILRCAPSRALQLITVKPSQTFSTLDLIFATKNVARNVMKCTIGSSHGSDHRSVLVEIDIPVAYTPPEPKSNWRAADWELYAQTVRESLQEADIATSLAHLHTTSDINNAAQKLNDAYLRANSTVPKKKPSPYSKCWWTPELTGLHQKFKHAENRAYKPRSTPEERAAVDRAKRKYKAAIRRAKWHCWKEFLEDATEMSIWQANKYATQAETPTKAAALPYIPDLHIPQGPALTTEEKRDILMQTFFPTPPPADVSDIDDVPDTIEQRSPTVSPDEIRNVIMSPGAFKAPGPSQTINAALQHAVDELTPILTDIANASLRLGYHPSLQKVFTTITLQKPGKDDYSIPKAYRPIALEDTISKVIETCFASGNALLR